MDRPKLEVADVFRRYGQAYLQQHAAVLSTTQRRTMKAIEVCRTAALGGARREIRVEENAAVAVCLAFETE